MSFGSRRNAPVSMPGRHFEAEGYRVTPNPLMLNVYLAASR